MQGVGYFEGPRAILTVRKEAKGSAILQLAGQVSIVPGPDSLSFPLHYGLGVPVWRREIASPHTFLDPSEKCCFAKLVGEYNSPRSEKE